jgi:hypothetical protein
MRNHGSEAAAEAGKDVYGMGEGENALNLLRV